MSDKTLADRMEAELRDIDPEDKVSDKPGVLLTVEEIDTGKDER